MLYADPAGRCCGSWSGRTAGILAASFGIGLINLPASHRSWQAGSDVGDLTAAFEKAYASRCTAAPSTTKIVPSLHTRSQPTFTSLTNLNGQKARSIDSYQQLPSCSSWCLSPEPCWPLLPPRPPGIMRLFLFNPKPTLLAEF